MIKRNQAALALLTLTTWSVGPSARAEAIAVIAGLHFPAATLSEDDVRLVYLGKLREISGIGPVQAVDLPNGPLHDEFAQKVLGKSPKELNAYWSVRIFSGRGTPPRTMTDVKDVKEWLAGHPDGIGYIDAQSVDSAVKVLLKVP